VKTRWADGNLLCYLLFVTLAVAGLHFSRHRPLRFALSTPRSYAPSLRGTDETVLLRERSFFGVPQGIARR